MLPTLEIAALSFSTTPVDLGFAATMNNVTSGVLFHNFTTPDDGFRVVFLHNCTTPHDGFPVDLGSAATKNNVTASGVLFHNCTMPHDCFRIDPNMSANNVMATGTQIEWRTFLNDALFDNMLEL